MTEIPDYDIIDDEPEEDAGDIYEIQLIVINEFGEFRGQKAELTKFHCDNIVKLSKTFYAGGGFELTCEDGSFMIFAPDIVQKSILKINKFPVLDEDEDSFSGEYTDHH